jgi:hypothetical protein
MRTIKQYFNLCIVFALIFGGGLALALDCIGLSLALFTAGIIIGIHMNKRNLLPA